MPPKLIAEGEESMNNVDQLWNKYWYDRGFKDGYEAFGTEAHPLFADHAVYMCGWEDGQEYGDAVVEGEEQWFVAKGYRSALSAS